MSVFDAWTKFQAGINSGNLVDLGHYDQCVEFKHQSIDSKVDEIRGQHCMIFYRPSANESINNEEGIFNWPDM